MKNLLAAICVTTLLLAGCGVTVVPKPTASATLDPVDNSLSSTQGGVKISARVYDLEVAPYRMMENITSFYILIDNRSGQEISIPLDAFVLVDGEGHQYRPVTPSKVQNVVQRDSQYLIPYPYVGYYYLEDAAQASELNTFESSLPYYAENYPQDVYVQALPAEGILPEAKVDGLIYFMVDLALKKNIELRVYYPDLDTSRPANYIFPFSIEK